MSSHSNRSGEMDMGMPQYRRQELGPMVVAAEDGRHSEPTGNFTIESTGEIRLLAGPRAT